MTLTQNQTQTLNGLLDKRYDALLEKVREELEHTENQQYVELLGRAPGDIGDESLADALADLSLGVIARHIRELRDIAATRSRLRGGWVGICIDCADEIGFERLKSIRRRNAASCASGNTSGRTRTRARRRFDAL